MISRRATIVCLALLICIVALALRLPQLSLRPMHADEAVQAVKFGQLLENNSYQYDPHEFHGPSLPYLALPFAWLQGKTTLASLTETNLRIIPVFLGIATILLLFLLRDAFSTPAIIIASLFAAVAPALTFYNRYYIHESLLVFDTVATLATLWRYSQKPSFAWAIAAGASFALLYSTKTTWIIAAASALIAWLITVLWQRLRPPLNIPHSSVAPGFRPVDFSPPSIKSLNIPPLISHLSLVIRHSRVSAWHIVAGVATAFIIVTLLFTSFFTWPRGLLDSLLAFGPYFGRGAGFDPDAVTHVHPWYFHLQNLLYVHHPRTPIWSHALIALLALAGTTAAFRPKLPGIHIGAVRFLTLFTFLIWAAYSSIPYKTPWLILTPLLALILLAGVGTLVLWNHCSKLSFRIPLAALLIAGLANLAWQSYAANFRFPASPVNPFVYVHTSPDIFELKDYIDSIAAIAPDHKNMLIRVILPKEQWPLPWYLRTYSRVGYWTSLPAPPDSLDSQNTAIIITSTQLAPTIEANLHTQYPPKYFGLRPGVLLMVYTRQDLWDRLIASRDFMRTASTPGAPGSK